MYQALVYNVFLASPGDVNDEREVARKIILDWNNINSLTRRIVLLPISWEYNSFPSIGDRPQEIINKQVLEGADILVGIFWTRIGTPTGKAVSGSVEEIEEHINSGKQAMLYFSNKPVVPDSIDVDQYYAVKKLKAEFQSKNLVEVFDSVDDFKNKFQRHLSMKLNEKEYQLSFMEEPNDSNLDTTEIRYNLSNEAKMLLKEASIDNAGQIQKAFYKGGFTFQTNGKQLNEDYSPRTKAKWEAAMEDLLNLDLVSELGYKGEIFQLTEKGFQVADDITI